MLNTKPQPDVLNLLNKLQESTTEDIDEERGSFKKGDKVVYNMFGSGLTNSDLIRTLDTNEHATRANHNKSVAEVVEAIGEEVSRYSIMFEDGFVVNDVAASELKSVDEQVEEFKPGDRVEALGDTYEVVSVGMENLIVRDSHEEETTIKKSDVEESKTNEAEEGELKFGDRVKDDEGNTAIIRKTTDETGDPDRVQVRYDDTGNRVTVHISRLEKIPESKTNEAEVNEKTWWGRLLDDLKKDKKFSKLVQKHGSRSEEVRDYFAKKYWSKTGTKATIQKAIKDATTELGLDESKTNEAEEATDTMKPQEKPDINAEDYHMEDYSEEELNKPEAKVKSKSEETGNAIRQVEDDELEQKEDKVVTSKKESKVNESVQTDIKKYKKSLESKAKKSGLWENFGQKEVNKLEDKYRDYQYKKDGIWDAVRAFDKWCQNYTVKKESKLKEEETEFTPSRSEMRKITDEKLKELHKSALKSQEYWAKDRTAPEKAEAAKQAAARYEKELVARGIITGVEVPNETKESKFSFMKKQEPLWLCNECYKTFRSDKNLCENCKSENVEKITEQYGPGFTKEVFQVTWKNTDTGEEKSTRVMAFDKADAKKEAKRPSRKITKVEGPIMEEPRKEEAKVPFDQDKGSRVNETVQELVREVPGISKNEQDILLQAIEKSVVSNEWPPDEIMIDELTKASEKGGVVPGKGAKDLDGLDLGEIRAVYLKYMLLPKAKKAAKASSESKIDEQEVEGVPEKGQTYQVYQKLGFGLPKGTYEVTNVEYRKTVRGELAKQFQVANDDGWWIAKFYGFKEVASESKVSEQEEDWDLTFQYKHNLIWHNPIVDSEGSPFIWQKHSIAGRRIRVFSDYQADWVERNKAVPVRIELEGVTEEKKPKHITAVEIVRSKVDPDAYNIRVVELPEGSIVILDSVSDRTEAITRGKEFARQLNAKFLGIVDEQKGKGKIKEQEDEVAPDEFAIETEDSHGEPGLLQISAHDESLGGRPDYTSEPTTKAIVDFVQEMDFDTPIKRIHIHDPLESFVDVEAIKKALGVDVELYEFKLKEQEDKDTFKTVAKGIVAKTLADEIATKEKGQVVQDEDDESKFMIITKVE